MSLLKTTFIGLFIFFTSPALADETDKQAIKDTLVAMWAAIEKGDVDAYASYIHPDFTAFGENAPYLKSGKGKEISSYRDYLKRSHDVHTDMHQAEVTVIGNVGWITYYWTDVGYSDQGRFTSRGKSTRIFVKKDGRWLSRHGHYTAVE